MTYHPQDPILPQGGLYSASPEEMTTWPHCPSQELLEQARNAHNAVYRQQPRAVTADTSDIHDLQLANIVESLNQLNAFREQALSIFSTLIHTFPDAPVRALLAATALWGNSPDTVGVANMTTSPEFLELLPPQQPGEQLPIASAAAITRVLRNTQWTGSDAIYPSFRGQEALIIGRPDTGAPMAVVGLPPRALEGEPQPGDFPDHPETAALQAVLTWHGANPRWLTAA